MPLIPNVDYTVIKTSTLTQIPLVGDQSYQYNMGMWCGGNAELPEMIGTTGVTSFSFCNLTSSAMTLGYYVESEPSWHYPNLSGVTVGPFDCYSFDIYYGPFDSAGEERLLLGFLLEGETEALGYLMVSANGEIRSLLDYENSGCFLNFGNVGLNSFITTTKEIINNTDRYVPISFTGDTGDFNIPNSILLSPGSNILNFSFNPQTPIGDKSVTLVLSGDCAPTEILLCGRASEGNTVLVGIEFTVAYVGCCSEITLKLSNNVFNSDTNYITITDIITDSLVTTTETFPVNIARGDCRNIIYKYCPIVSGITPSSITVNYTYQSGEVIFNGQSKIELELSGFTHPFTTISSDCVNFRCKDIDTEKILQIYNPSNQNFNFYYNFEVNNGYEFNNIFTVSPDPYVTIPPYSTTGLTITLNSEVLTTGTSFNNTFYLNLIDPNCCQEFKQCVNINFCPTTLIPNYGYPKNVSCYGGRNGEYSFYLNDCSSGYTISWSADTTINDYTDKLSANDLYAGNYIITITNNCNEITTQNFTITQPEPLYLDIHWTNPANYCKSDLKELCGIVNSPTINPAGYVVIDKETLVKVVNNDMHDIPGQTKRGYQQYAAGENEISHGNRVDPINSFRNYILDFFSGPFNQYKTKWKKEEVLTIQSWDEIVRKTIGTGCCFAPFVSGGTMPYTYQWNGPRGYTSTSPNIFDRPCCEEYNLLVTDANGCTISATSTCLLCTFEIETLTTVNPTCSESNDGEIYVVVSGNCPNEIYKIQLESDSWVESYTASTATFNRLYKGDYVLTVENLETECKLEPVNITLTPKYLFSVTENITGTTCLQSCDGIVKVNVNVTNNEDRTENIFLYTLDGQYQDSNVFSGVCSGNHTLNVMNTINYCQSTKIINTPNLGLFDVTTDVIPASGPKESDGEIIITVVNGQSICNDYECYEFVNTEDLPIDIIYSDTDECIIISEEDNCMLEFEIGQCRELIEFINGSYTIKNIKPGTYFYILTDNRGCRKIFKVIVGWSIVKKPSIPHFDSRRIDTNGGAKISSNTPQGQ